MMDISTQTIGIIGAGNMGSALIGGFLRNHIAPGAIWVGQHGSEKCAALAKQWHVHATTDNVQVATLADILLLAIKPAAIPALLKTLRPALSPQTLIISIAAGITTTQIEHWLEGTSFAIIRAMPNTPALLGEGITGMFANPTVSATQKALGAQLLQTVGKTVWLETESLMDVVTALSGSGPAYFFYVMEALIAGAQQLGLPEEIARELTLQTALGSATMAQQSSQSLAQLRQKVTSPGGTTEQGINALKDGKLSDLLLTALRQATLRAQSLTHSL